MSKKVKHYNIIALSLSPLPVQAGSFVAGFVAFTGQYKVTVLPVSNYSCVR